MMRSFGENRYYIKYIYKYNTYIYIYMNLSDVEVMQEDISGKI